VGAAKAPTPLPFDSSISLLCDLPYNMMRSIANRSKVFSNSTTILSCTTSAQKIEGPLQVYKMPQIEVLEFELKALTPLHFDFL